MNRIENYNRNIAVILLLIGCIAFIALFAGIMAAPVDFFSLLDTVSIKLIAVIFSLFFVLYVGFFVYRLYYIPSSARFIASAYYSLLFCAILAMGSSFGVHAVAQVSKRHSGPSIEIQLSGAGTDIVVIFLILCVFSWLFSWLYHLDQGKPAAV